MTNQNSFSFWSAIFCLDVFMFGCHSTNSDRYKVLEVILLLKASFLWLQLILLVVIRLAIRVLLFCSDTLNLLSYDFISRVNDCNLATFELCLIHVGNTRPHEISPIENVVFNALPHVDFH